MYKLVQKAEQYKKLGFYDKELNIYKKIHNDYFPNSSSLFKRPAILYEKQGEYDKALELCKNAIELINTDKISGTTNSFEKMIVILERKINNTNKDTPSKSNSKKSKQISVGLIITLLIFFSFAYYLTTKESTYEDIQIDLTEMSNFNELNEETDTNEAPEYPITDEMIKKTKLSINIETSVIDSAILKTNSSIGLGLLVSKGTSYSKSKKLCEKFIDELGQISANEYNFIAKRKIYDYYNVYVSVGTSNNKEDIILKAFKIKGGKKINYK